MKINKIFSVLLASALAFASCSKEPAYVPGEAENPDCYGVYFPEQEATGYHATPETSVEFRVARTNTKGRIEVPVELISDSDVFAAQSIVFEDGEAETSLILDYAKAESNNEYSVQIEINDPAYASLYSSNICSLSYTVLLVQIHYIGVKDGKAVIVDDKKDAAKINWTQIWWEEEHSGLVQFYEIDGIRYCSTITDTTPEGASGFWGTGHEIEFLWRAEDNYLFYEPICVGPYDATHDIFMYDEYGYWNYVNASNAGSWADAQEYYDEYPEELPLYCSFYKDGTFNFKVNRYYMIGLGGWTQDSEAVDVYGVPEGLE